jgi:hypothetical protein
MMALIETWKRGHTVVQRLEVLERAGVPRSDFREPGDALSGPHVLERGLFTPLSDGAGEFVGVSPPWQMSGTRTNIRERVPGTAEHPAQSCPRGLGYRLRRCGVSLKLMRWETRADERSERHEQAGSHADRSVAKPLQPFVQSWCLATRSHVSSRSRSARHAGATLSPGRFA